VYSLAFRTSSMAPTVHSRRRLACGSGPLSTSRRCIRRTASAINSTRCGLITSVLATIALIPGRPAIADPPGLFGGPYYSNSTRAQNASGQIIGYADGSFTNSTGGVSTVRDAWFYNGGSTAPIAFYETTIDQSPNRNSEPRDLNEAGDVIGFSKLLYNGVPPTGVNTMQIAWLYHNGATIKLSLDNAIASGYLLEDDQAVRLNESGDVAGYSAIFRPNEALQWGQTGRWAWIYDGTQMRPIGLTNGYFRDVNAQLHYTEVKDLWHNAPVASGISPRADGGSDPWIYDGQITRKIPVETSSANTVVVGIDGWTTSGASVTRVLEYSGPTYKKTAWWNHGSSFVKIGLTGPEYTDLDGDMVSYATDFEEAGRAFGFSDRYINGLHAGRNAWCFNGATTVKIGLTDAAHTSFSGEQYSIIYRVVSSGKAIGSAVLYVNNVNWAQDLWLYDGVSTMQIGLVDAGHTGPSGERLVEDQGLNQAGQAIGTSLKFKGSEYNGYTGWFYDPTHHQTIPLQLSQRPDGYAVTFGWHLSEDGLTVGEYHLFDGAIDRGRRVFYFRPGDVPRDLGDLMDAEYNAHIWDWIDSDDFDGATRTFVAHSLDGAVLTFSVPEFLPGAGDYDASGVVDGADLSKWSEDLGLRVPPGSGGDGDGNGVVDGSDFLLWQQKLGATSPAVTANFSVPEPNALALSAAALAMLGLRPKRRVLPPCRIRNM
jgi:hypothetical protein